MRVAVLRVVVVIADGDAEDLLGFVLPNDEAIEVPLNVARSVVEIEEIEGIFDDLRPLALTRRLGGLSGRADVLTKSGTEELREFLLDLLGSEVGWLVATHSENVSSPLRLSTVEN